jgi:hypothetical protein
MAMLVMIGKLNRRTPKSMTCEATRHAEQTDSHDNVRASPHVQHACMDAWKLRRVPFVYRRTPWHGCMGRHGYAGTLTMTASRKVRSVASTCRCETSPGSSGYAILQSRWVAAFCGGGGYMCCWRAACWELYMYDTAGAHVGCSIGRVHSTHLIVPLEVLLVLGVS